MKNNYKAAVILVYNPSLSNGKVIVDKIVDMIGEDYVGLKTSDTWAVSGADFTPEETAQKQLEERYPDSTVIVIGKRVDDLSTKCKYIIDADHAKKIYVCYVNPDDGFVPVFNDNIYYINLFYEMDPKSMECTFGLAARDMIEKHRRVSELFRTGEDNRFNRADYVISPMLTDRGINRSIGLASEISEIIQGDGFFVDKIMFDAFNGCCRCADVLRELLFRDYD